MSNPICGHRSVAALLLVAALAATANANFYDANVLADNPRFYLRLSEPVGPTAFDSAPNGGAQNGTYLNGATLSVVGINAGATDGNTAARFDGVSQMVQIMDALHPSAYTIEAWVKANVGFTTGRSIIVRTAWPPTATWSLQLRITNTGKFEHYTYDGTVRSIVGTTTVQPDQWYHVVGTAQNSDGMKLYVNGALEATGGFTLGTLWQGGNQWLLASNSGDASGTGPINFFRGALDEVAMYDTVLSAQDILEHYRLGMAPEPTTCLLLGGGLLALARRRRKA